MAGDVNFYRYVGGDPVNFVDPFGHKKCDKKDKDKRKKSLKKKGGKFQDMLGSYGDKILKRTGTKAAGSAVLAVVDGFLPIGDIIGLAIMADEFNDIRKEVSNFQDTIENIRSEINEMIECEKESDKKDGTNVKGKKDKCKSLEGKPQSNGKFHGGKHKTLQAGGNGVTPNRQSHHMPPKSAYGKGKNWKGNNEPAIQMTTAHHNETYSHGSWGTAKAYQELQKYMVKNNLTVVAMAMDIMDVKSISDNYDEAMTEMVLWAICTGKI
jgi:hypothetical protein